MHIYLLESFYSGSHKQWADGLKQYSGHDITIFSLSGHHWKWRMHGAAVSLAEKVNASKVPDLFILTDMVDVAVFKGLLDTKFKHVPIHLYFHENQITYPWSTTDSDVKLKRDNHYGWINYTSALAADKIFFNSNYHLEAFTSILPSFLSQFPDHQNLQSIASIKSKSSVQHLNLDLKKLENFKHEEKSRRPLILWNHRWEYDKNPEQFFEMLFDLNNEGIDFELCVMGEKFEQDPEVFDIAQSKLKDNIVHFGFAQSIEEYAYWLWKADVLPVTSNQDFFGGSIVEAMHCDTIPLLPNRLCYGEHMDSLALYGSYDALKDKLKDLLTQPFEKDKLIFDVSKYDWSNMNENNILFQTTL